MKMFCSIAVYIKAKKTKKQTIVEMRTSFQQKLISSFHDSLSGQNVEDNHWVRYSSIMVSAGLLDI